MPTGICILIAAFAAGPGTKAMQPVVDRELAMLIVQLDSPSFAERDAATRQMRGYGWVALVALRRAIRETDSPEVAMRAEDLTKQILSEMTGLRRSLIGDGKPLYAAKFTANGRRVVAAGDGGKVFVWDSNSGKTLSEWSIGFRVYGMAVSEDGGWAIFGGTEGQLARLNLETGEAREMFENSKKATSWNDLALSYDEKRIVGVGVKHSAIWDAETGKQLAVLPKEAWVMNGWGTAFLPDGKECVTACGSGIQIWNAQSGERIKSVGSGECGGIGVSPSGTRAVVGASTGALGVWNLETGKQVWSANAHTGWSCWPVFSPDGKRVSSCGHDHLVKLWDAETGKLVHTYRGNAGIVLRSQFRPDGRVLLTAGWDGVVRLWNVPP